MKKLSEFTGNGAMEVVADLLPLTFDVTMNEQIKDVRAHEHKVYDFVSAILKYEPDTFRNIYKVLSDGEELQDNAADIMRATVEFMSDSDLLRLFGVRIQK